MKVKRNPGKAGVTVELRPEDERLMEAGARAAAAAEFRLHRIVVPVDFSPPGEKALAYAQAFARQFGAGLTLLHVVEVSVVPDSFGIIPPGYEEMNAALRTAAEQRLAELAGRLQAPGGVRAEVRVGRPSWEIVALAREREADLILLATRGHSGLRHVLLGSTAEYVVRHAPCPVLTVREQEQDFVTGA